MRTFVLHAVSRIGTITAACCIVCLNGFPALAQDTTGISRPDENKIVLLPTVIVTATRENASLFGTPASVSLVNQSAIQSSHPTHPSEITRYVPGVWVNSTGGESHLTAIRLPIGQDPVYLYLEDGLPTRSTGFFNPNALYEINVPQSAGVEITRGPGSVLYGSDAIGGIINVLTNPPPAQGTIEAGLEAGSFGWQRTLITGGGPIGASRVRADVNLTAQIGWRKSSGYHRESATMRWDFFPSNRISVRTVAAYAHVDQATAGAVLISKNDFDSDPSINYTPDAFRKLDAFRLSSAVDIQTGEGLLSVTPYFRYSASDMIPNWMLMFDPVVQSLSNASFGAQTKYRFDVSSLRSRIIAGLDYDNSPGSHQERVVHTNLVDYPVIRTGVYGASVYDYDVNFHEAAPYAQWELSPTAALRVTGGVRFDFAGYTYKTALAPADSGKWHRPSDRTLSYSHVSPKFGVTYTFSEAVNMFVAYAHGFRVPSESELFRQGQTLNTVDLVPAKVNSFEIGARGGVTSGIQYEVSLYTMTKADDIVTIGQLRAVNAKKTTHSGVEAGIGMDLPYGFRCDAVYSYARHTYGEFIDNNGYSVTDYAGKEIENAPRDIANIGLTWNNAAFSATLQAFHLGEYWMDAANTAVYPGHVVVGASVSVRLAGGFDAFVKIENLLDKKYAEIGTLAFGPALYTAGAPRSFSAGVRCVF